VLAGLLAGRDLRALCDYLVAVMLNRISSRLFLSAPSCTLGVLNMYDVFCIPTSMMSEVDCEPTNLDV
jgi:hypothetical protein